LLSTGWFQEWIRA